ncbi:MAG: Ig-like domain-containing protein [Bacteroidota bacterium]
MDVLMGFDINLVDDDTGGDSFDSKKSYYNENPTSHNDPSTLGFAQLAGDDGTTYFTLTTLATNGDITLDPSGGTYAENAAVSASASADEGYEFSDWDGAYDGTNNPVDIIMDGNKSLTANFSPIAVTGVSIDQTGPVSVTEGSTTTLSATVSPGDALDQSISWSSGDEAIATVNSSGTVTGVAVGSATITVTTNDGGYTDNITVDVTEVPDVPVTGVSIDQTGPIALTEGNTTTLSATVSPSDATDQGVSWSSSDDAIATVTSNGTVTAEAEGSATITVTTNDGGFTDNITIDVSAPVPSDDVIPWLENFTGLPDGTTSESETSSDWSLNGTTNGGGNYLFEVSSEKLEARHLTEEVSFQSAAIDISSATAVEISIDLTQGGGMEGDDYVKLYYKVDGGSEVLADEVSDDLSSSPYQLSVSNIAGSTLEVIIKMNNDGWGESWIVDNISVQSTSSTPVTGVSIDQSGPIALTEGNTTTLSATVLPSDATDQSVSWASSDDAIATVDANGVVTGEADGTATITVTTNDGGYTDDITVNVAAPGTDNEIPWLEDFSGLSDGTTSESGTSSDWSLTGTANGGGNYLFEVSSEQLIAQNLQEEVSFNSATIDISSATSVDISLDITQNGGMEGDDYVKLYYKVDGGSETLADEVSDDLPNSPYQLSATGISGNTLEVIVKMLNVNGWSEAWKIDNISVTDPKSAEAELSMGSASSVKLYPNPTSSNAGLHVELKGFENETEATISIMDISGRIAYSKNVQTQDIASQRVSISLDGVSAGMYMVSVRGNNKVINQRLIVR